MEPFPEPKVLYPEPLLDPLEVLEIIRGSTFFAAIRTLLKARRGL
jgi:hypothetical protein